jgi:hypothetical protein
MVNYLTGHTFGTWPSKDANKGIYVDVPTIVIPKQHKRMATSEFAGVVKYYQKNNLLNNHLFEKSKKFTVVRNTYDRLLSTFFYAKQKGWIGNKMSFERFIEIDLDTWKNSKPEVWNHAVPVYQYLRDKNDSLEYLDYVTEVHQIPQMLERIRADFGITSSRPFPHLNPSTRPRNPDLYTSKLRKIVAQRYEEEIDFFKFSFEKAFSERT